MGLSGRMQEGRHPRIPGLVGGLLPSQDFLEDLGYFGLKGMSIAILDTYEITPRIILMGLFLY